MVLLLLVLLTGFILGTDKLLKEMDDTPDLWTTIVEEKKNKWLWKQPPLKQRNH